MHCRRQHRSYSRRTWDMGRPQRSRIDDRATPTTGTHSERNHPASHQVGEVKTTACEEKSHDARNCARSLHLADDPDVCHRENQEALKRYRLMPSFLILDSSVCRGIPSLTAAPVGPPTTPSDSRSAASSISLSCSARLATSGTDAIADLGATCVSQASSTKKVSPSHRITARSTTFCNSRMLPGQS